MCLQFRYPNAYFSLRVKFYVTEQPARVFNLSLVCDMSLSLISDSSVTGFNIYLFSSFKYWRDVTRSLAFWLVATHCYYQTIRALMLTKHYLSQVK